MTKIAIIGDMHIGARNSNKTVERWQNKFFDEFFFKYLEENNIKRVFQLGDFFDNRKWINVQSIDNMVEHVITPTKKLDLQWDVLVGNHDIPLRNTLRGHTPGIMLSQYENFTIHDTVNTVEVDDVSFTMVPWICKENMEESQKVIREGGDIILGHFEINGFVMHPGAISKEGISMTDFKNWDTVWSGHYHSQSNNSNISYLGTPYQMCWSDATTKHGFWVFDTVDRSMQFIENPFKYFHRIFYNDGSNYDLETIKDGYVKINVNEKTDVEKFEWFVSQVNFNSPYEVKIIENHEEWNQENVQDLIQVATTEDLITSYIEEVSTETNKDSITSKMLEIYQSAMSLEE